MTAEASPPDSTDFLYQTLVVDLCLPIRGATLPADHGYGLLAALCHRVPMLHRNPCVGILTTAGIRDRQGKILLTPHSHIRIRLPIEAVAEVYKLAGKQLKIGSHEVQLGIPKIFTLKPSTSLKARIVTIKGYTEPDTFAQAAQAQLEKLKISGQVTVLQDKTGKPLRKTLRIKGHTIIGFSTLVENLQEEDSIRLQQVGLGGRRRMGCGFFLPYK
ncbi:type I-MYXAN CRISPR-associated protein Cas6/Cmx6 [Synechococcus sp. H60.3]